MECNVLSLLSAGDLSGTEIPLFLKTIIATAAIYKINKVVLVIDKQILKKKTAIMPVDEEAIDSLLAKARETLNQIDCDKQVKSLLSSRWCYSDNFKEAKDASILVRECDCQISTQNWLDVFLSLTPLFYGKNLVINGQSGNIQARIALQIFASSETTIKKHFYFDSSFKNGLKKERADSAASCLRHPEAFEDYRNLDDEILPNSSRLQRSQETRTMILRVFKKNFRESLNDNDLTGALNLLEKQYRGIVSIPQKDVVLLHCYAATPHEIIASSLQNDVVNLPGGKKKYNIAAIQATLQALLTHLSYSYLQKSEKAAIDAITTYGYFFNIISHLNLDDPLNPLVLSSAPHLTNPYAPSYKEEIQALGKLKAVSKSFDWDSFHIMETYKHKHHENSRLLGNAVSSNAFNDLLEIYGSLFKSNFSFPLFSKFRSRILKQALNPDSPYFSLMSDITGPDIPDKCCVVGMCGSTDPFVIDLENKSLSDGSNRHFWHTVKDYHGTDASLLQLRHCAAAPFYFIFTKEMMESFNPTDSNGEALEQKLQQLYQHQNILPIPFADIDFKDYVSSTKPGMVPDYYDDYSVHNCFTYFKNLFAFLLHRYDKIVVVLSSGIPAFKMAMAIMEYYYPNRVVAFSCLDPQKGESKQLVRDPLLSTSHLIKNIKTNFSRDLTDENIFGDLRLERLHEMNFEDEVIRALTEANFPSKDADIQKISAKVQDFLKDGNPLKAPMLKLNLERLYLHDGNYFEFFSHLTFCLEFVMGYCNYVREKEKGPSSLIYPLIRRMSFQSDGEERQTIILKRDYTAGMDEIIRQTGHNPFGEGAFFKGEKNHISSTDDAPLRLNYCFDALNFFYFTHQDKTAHGRTLYEREQAIANLWKENSSIKHNDLEFLSSPNGPAYQEALSDLIALSGFAEDLESLWETVKEILTKRMSQMLFK
jgi:hypothetical protein